MVSRWQRRNWLTFRPEVEALEARETPTVSFAPQQTFQVGSFPTSLAVADFNGDGKPDVVVGNQGNQTMSVLLNTTAAGAASSSFAPQQTFAAGNSPVSVAVADLNGDGKPDLAVVNVGDETVAVLLNTTPTGSSTLSFAAAQTFAVGFDPASVAVADFNGDGKPDLVVDNFNNGGAGTLSVLVNTTAAGAGTGTFAAPQTFAVGTEAEGVAVGDFNGDGKPDLAVVNGNGNTWVSVLLNTTSPGASTVTLATPQTFTVGGFPDSLLVGDFNGDGRPDLVVTNSSGRSVSVLLNATAAGSPTASFAAQQTFAVGNLPLSSAAGDFDGDGRPDLAVLNGNDNALSVLSNATAAGSPTASFAAQQTFAVGPAPNMVAVGDFNGDGQPDLVAVNSNANTVSVVLNTTAPTASPQAVAVVQGLSRALTLTGSVSASDSFTFQIATNPSHGTLSGLNATTGAVIYTPTDSYTGPDSFTFTVTDTTKNLTSPAATIGLTVAVPPTANPKSLTVVRDQGTTFTLTGSAPNNDPLLFTLTAQPVHGNLSGFNAGTGQVTYKTAGNYTGLDSFKFTVTDTVTGLTSAAATVFLTVSAPPWADTQAVTVSPGHATVITLTALVSNNDPVSFAVTANPAHGTLSGLNPGTGQVTYTPAEGYVGTDSFQFTVTDTAIGLTSPAEPEYLAVASTTVGQFGGAGVWQYNRATGAWAQLTAANASLLAVDAFGDVAAEFPHSGVWLEVPGSGWQQLTTVDATLLTIDTEGNVTGEFPNAGVWQYTPGSGWAQLTRVDASLLTASDSGVVTGEFAGAGIWQYLPASGWKQLTVSNAALLAAYTTGALVGEFAGYGLWQYTASSGWKQLTPSDAAALAVDDLGDVVAEFPHYGAWRYAASAGWKQLTLADAVLLALDADGDVYAEFAGYGVWQYDPVRGWVRITPVDGAALASA